MYLLCPCRLRLWGAGRISPPWRSCPPAWWSPQWWAQCSSPPGHHNPHQPQWWCWASAWRAQYTQLSWTVWNIDVNIFFWKCSTRYYWDPIVTVSIKTFALKTWMKFGTRSWAVTKIESSYESKCKICMQCVTWWKPFCRWQPTWRCRTLLQIPPEIRNGT